MFTATVVEHLEAQELDGRPSFLVATDGDTLMDDFAFVLSFATNSLFHTDFDLVRDLLGSHRRRRSASALFRETFDADRFLSDAEVDRLREFMTALLELRRDKYEAVMLAIRRYVRATFRAYEDPTLAYVDLVAALESLADMPADERPAWDRLDGRKRKLIDASLKGVGEAEAGRVRDAVLEAEHAGARWRFQRFVLAHIQPEYYRDGASQEVQPMRGPDIPLALDKAYAIRSRSVHSLAELPEHVTAFHAHADMVIHPREGVLFTLHGLARLARHVIGNAVDRASREHDSSFNWRDAVPGRIEVTAAPQYWLWQAAGYGQLSAPRYFGGFADHVLGLRRGEGEGVPPMKDVLERIEQLLPTTRPGPAKASMLGLYRVWHGVVHPSHYRPDAEAVINAHADALADPSMVAFVTGLLCGAIPAWSDDHWTALGEARRIERTRKRQLALSPRFDVALQAFISLRHRLQGRSEDALHFAELAMEEAPGDPTLLAWESALRAGTASELDIGHVLTGKVEPDENEARTDEPDEN